MGRTPCCDKVGLKKGPWTPEEDQKLLAYIEEHGHGSWRALPTKAGLQRCGKSCRLRWTNYLRPDIKRGKFSMQEEQTIIQLHALLGNRWSAIATHLPRRTDNEIKNYWNTHLKKRLAKMGIDPVTHKPKTDAHILCNDEGGQSRHAANLSHMAQWESARLEAEARLVRQSKLRSVGASNSSFHNNMNPGLPLNLHPSPPDFSSSPSSSSPLTKPSLVPPRCLDILKAWNGTTTVWSKPINTNNDHAAGTRPAAGHHDQALESPTSTVSYSETNAPQMSSNENIGDSYIDFVGNNSSSSNCEGDGGMMKEEGHDHEDWKGNIDHNSMTSFTSGALVVQDTTTITSMDNTSNNKSTAWTTGESLGPNPEDPHHQHVSAGCRGNFVETFTDLLLSSSGGSDRSFCEGCGESSDHNGDPGGSSGEAAASHDYLEDNKNYWNSILNLVNSSPSDSPVF